MRAREKTAAERKQELRKKLTTLQNGIEDSLIEFEDVLEQRPRDRQFLLDAVRGLSQVAENIDPLSRQKERSVTHPTKE